MNRTLLTASGVLSAAAFVVAQAGQAPQIGSQAPRSPLPPVDYTLGPDSQPQPNVPKGAVTDHTLAPGKYFPGTPHRYQLYVPSQYTASRPAPFMIFLDGAGYAGDAVRVPVVLDNLIAKGEVKPLIVVMTLGYGVNINQLRTGIPRDQGIWRTNAEKYGETLLQEVMPAVEKAYKLDPKRTSRAITGLSMGGGESLLIGLNNLDKFAYVGAFSAGGGGGEPEKVYPKLSAKDNERVKLLWIACGKDDRLIEPNRKFVEWLNAKGVKNTFVETPGAHTWLVWRRYLTDFTKSLNW